MSAKPRDLGMTPLDDLFSTDESRAEAQLEKVVMLNPADISDFPSHPFKVKQERSTLPVSIPLISRQMVDPFCARNFAFSSLTFL